MLSAISTADMLYDKKCRRSEQSPASKSKLDKVPLTMDVSWEGYTDLGRPAPKPELIAFVQVWI
jgi:hypothetical protein